MPDRLTCTAIDGSQVVLQMPGAAVGAPASCMALARVGQRRLDLASGVTAHGARRAAAVGVTLDEEYEYHGGRLRVGSRQARTARGVLDRVRTAVWEGRRHCLSFHLNGAATTSDVLAVLDGLRVDETGGGITVREASGDPLWFVDGPSVLKPVKGTGILEVGPLTSRVARWLPRWAGTRVLGGELFVTDPRGPRMHFMLVAGTAFASLVPLRGADPDAIADRLASTRVAWDASSGAVDSGASR
ncbi:MAG: hypothetical protein ACRD0K_04130 [Egibacteraceae bacterium]